VGLGRGPMQFADLTTLQPRGGGSHFTGSSSTSASTSEVCLQHAASVCRKVWRRIVMMMMVMMMIWSQN
jgi:hypothetical protein